MGEFLEYVGQQPLCVTRVRMRGAKDPPSPLDQVLCDGLGFEQVVACDAIKNGSMRGVLIQTQVVAGAVGIVPEGCSKILAEIERPIVIGSQRSSSRG